MTENIYFARFPEAGCLRVSLERLKYGSIRVYTGINMCVQIKLPPIKLCLDFVSDSLSLPLPTMRIAVSGSLSGGQRQRRHTVNVTFVHGK